MAGFLYYLPHSGAVNAQAIKESGLRHIFPDDQYTQVPVMRGPSDDASGCVIASNNTEQPGYYPDKQEWLQCAGGKYWLGWTVGAEPGPDDLLRGAIKSSYRFVLSDGREWLCPVARALPSYWGFDETDKRVRMLRPEYRELSARAETAWIHWDEENAIFDPDWVAGVEAADICIDALALNYRIGPREAAAIGMPSGDDVIIILAGLLDIPNGAKCPKTESKKNE